MIYRNEIYKLIHTRIFLLVLICASLLNIYISFSQNFGLQCPAKEYKDYYALAEGKTFQEAYDYTVARRDNMFAGWGNGNWEVRMMMSGQLEQLKAVGTYRSYLQSIDDTAATMTAVSIFADPDSFAYRNIIKTPSAYDNVRNIQPVFAPSNGVLLAAQNVPSDILMLFIIFTAVTVIFYKDRESGITGLVKPLRYGRTRLALTKMSAVFTACLFTEGVIFLMNLWIGSVRYGLGDLSRPIQSLAGYLGCNLRITVSQFLVLTFVYKFLALLICALIAQAFFIRLKNVTAYLLLILIGGVETALYLLISETSMLSVFKQINLAAFVNSSHLFVTYTNINLFNHPINLIGSTSVSIILLITVFALVSIRLYNKMSIAEIKKTRRRIFRHKAPKGLFGYTLYKEFVMHKGAIILIAALAFQIYAAYSYIRPYNAMDNFYRAYTNDVYGLSTSNNVYDYMIAEREGIHASFVAAMSGQFYDAEYWTRRNAFQKLANQYNNAMKVSGGKNLAHYMYYTTGYEEMFGVNGFRQDFVLGLVAILGICFAVAPLIAYDNRARIGFLLYTTKAGKRTYFAHNAITAAIYAMLISLAVYIPYYVQMLVTYGTVGLFDPVSAIAQYANLGGLSVLEYMILLTLYRIISLIAFAELVLFVSYKSKSPTTATILMLAVFALPIVIYLAGANFMQWLCWPISGNREVLRRLV